MTTTESRERYYNKQRMKFKCKLCGKISNSLLQAIAHANTHYDAEIKVTMKEKKQ